MITKKWVCFAYQSLLILTGFVGVGKTFGEEGLRFFDPTPGFMRAKDIAADFEGIVDSIEFSIKDAFEGAAVHSEAEAMVFDLGNKLHINTRESAVRQRLPFRKGDRITGDLLRESEKALRGEEFLADAVVEVKKLQGKAVIVRVTTFDQWTTVPAFSLNRKGKEFVWWLGPVESNLLGTGQRVGFFFGHELERDSRYIDFNNNSLSPLKLKLSTQYAWLSDGYSYSLTLNRPLLVRTDQWGMSLIATGSELSENYYLSGNDLDRLARENRLSDYGKTRLGVTSRLGQWTKVGTHRTYVGFTRAFGYALKSSISPFYERKDRYNAGRFGRFDSAIAIWDSLGLPNRAPSLNTRHDAMLGLHFSLYQYAYKTVHNFRNLKWSENLETGWRLSSSLAKNQSGFGAANTDWRLTHSAVYNDAWMNSLFVNTNGTLAYFLNPSGDLNDGSSDFNLETQWKPFLYTATVMTAQYETLFAGAESRKLSLGEESGLIGFPNFYYTGRARVLFAAEQRLFPPFELGTLVPAFAVFLNAGNTYQAYDAIDLNDMHYAMGVGIRLGATRSVQKVVNHINVAWPLGEQNLSSWSFGIRASKTL